MVDLDSYINKLYKLEGQIRERNKMAEEKLVVYKQQVTSFDPSIKEAMLTEYGIDLEPFLSVDITSLSKEELDILKETAENAVEKICKHLDTYIFKFGG